MVLGNLFMVFFVKGSLISKQQKKTMKNPFLMSQLDNDDNASAGYSSESQQGSSWATASEDTRCAEMYL